MLGLLGGLHRDAQDRLGHVVRDLACHLVEVGAGLVLVRDERILLAVAAQVDALAELLHRREVLDPVRVDRPEEQPPLDRARDLLAEGLLAGRVGVVDELLDLRLEVVARPEAGEGLEGDVVGPAEQRCQGRDERGQVPVLGVR